MAKVELKCRSIAFSDQVSDQQISSYGYCNKTILIIRNICGKYQSKIIKCFTADKRMRMAAYF